MKEWVQIVQHIENNIEHSQNIALATVIEVEGSAYRRVGARMLVLEDGTWLGSISGGCLEGDMLKKAQLAMDSQAYKIVTYDTREEDPFELGIGLGCNGKIVILINPFKDQIIEFCRSLKKALDAPKATWLQSTWNFTQSDQSTIVELNSDKNTQLKTQLIIEDEIYQLTESISPQPRIWIVGNQFDAVSLILNCQQLGWKIFWVGNVHKMKSNYKKHCEKVLDWADDLNILSSDYVVFMTHDLDRDVEMMEKLADKSPFAYWGILGPKARMDKILKQLNDKGVSINAESISSPIGLDLGAEGPDEISISILAEILAKVNERSAQPLKNRKSPIHTSE